MGGDRREPGLVMCSRVWGDDGGVMFLETKSFEDEVVGLCFWEEGAEDSVREPILDLHPMF